MKPGNVDFVWFIGIVDAIDDPLQLGRLRVRIIDDYDEKVDSEDIPWATVLSPTTSSAFIGTGTSPTGILPGTRVMGFFLDGSDRSKPVVMGTIPFINNGKDTEHSVNPLARGTGPVQKDYLEYEPKSSYAAQYPFNNTITTRSGHVIEVDDTPEAERIHIYHKAGAYIEIFPDGKIVTKSPKDNIEISIGDKQIISDEENVFVSAKKNIDLVSVEGEGALVSKQNVGVVSTDSKALLAGKTEVNIETEKTIINSDTEITGDTELKRKLEVGGESDFNDDVDIDGKLDVHGNVTLVGAVNVKGSLRVNGRPVDLK